LWGPKAVRVFGTLRRGYALGSTLHADSAEEAVAQLTEELGVAPADLARVTAAARRVDAHHHQQVHAREVCRRDAELLGQLSHGLFRAVGVEGRSEGVPTAQRAEDADRLRAPEVHRQMRRQLVRKEDRFLGACLLEEVERLRPSAHE